MTDRKEKFAGMALEMDVIKKIGHQLERMPPAGAGRVLAFVRDWAERRTVIADVPLGNNGQLSLAVSKEDTFG